MLLNIIGMTLSLVNTWALNRQTSTWLHRGLGIRMGGGWTNAWFREVLWLGAGLDGLGPYIGSGISADGVEDALSVGAQYRFVTLV